MLHLLNNVLLFFKKSTLLYFVFCCVIQKVTMLRNTTATMRIAQLGTVD